MKIITDTNIWYDIAEGKYDHIQLSSLPIYLTGWTVMELISSPKLIMKNEKEKVINAAKAIKRISPGFISEEPYSFIAKKILGIELQFEHKFEYDLIKKLADNKLTENEIQTNLNFRNERVRGFTSDIRRQRENFSKVTNSINWENPEDQITGVIQRTISEMEKKLNISRNQINAKIESEQSKHLNFFFWIRAVDNFKLHFEKGYKAKNNDQGDLLNMIYVGQEDKYWTSDCKWIQNIIDAGLNRFLFTSSPFVSINRNEYA